MVRMRLMRPSFWGMNMSTSLSAASRSGSRERTRRRYPILASFAPPRRELRTRKSHALEPVAGPTRPTGCGNSSRSDRHRVAIDGRGIFDVRRHGLGSARRKAGGAGHRQFGLPRRAGASKPHRRRQADVGHVAVARLGAALGNPEAKQNLREVRR
jgi:hypothetical protein